MQIGDYVAIDIGESKEIGRVVKLQPNQVLVAWMDENKKVRTVYFPPEKVEPMLWRANQKKVQEPPVPVPAPDPAPESAVDATEGTK